MAVGVRRECVNGCGRAADDVVVMGATIELRFCHECGDAAAAEEDAARREQVLADALRQAGATPRLLEQSLDTYPADGTAALRFARAWLERYRAGSRENLWLVGPVGSGKTGLVWGLVRALTEESVQSFHEEERGERPAAVARLVVWRDLLDRLREAMDGTDSSAAAAYERAKRIPVLALDDLGAERATGYAVERLAGIVQARYEARLPLVVTTNYAKDDLAARLAGDDPVVGRRIVDRLRDEAVGITLARPSRRTLAA